MQLKRTLRGTVLIASACVAFSSGTAYAQGSVASDALGGGLPDPSALLANLPVGQLPVGQLPVGQLPVGQLPLDMPTLPGVDQVQGLPGAVLSCLPTEALPVSIPGSMNAQGGGLPSLDQVQKHAHHLLREGHHVLRMVEHIDFAGMSDLPAETLSCLSLVLPLPATPAIPGLPTPTVPELPTECVEEIVSSLTDNLPVDGLPVDGLPVGDLAGGLPVGDLAGGLPVGDLAGGLPLNGLPVDGLPVGDLAGGLPVGDLPVELPDLSNVTSLTEGLPVDGLTEGLPVGDLTGGLPVDGLDALPVDDVLSVLGG